MRELILARIQELKERYSDFSPRTMRWEWFRHQNIPIHMLDFEAIKDDGELLELYERIVRQCSTMM